MSLKDLAKELENQACLKGVELFIDITTEDYSFIPIINEKGVVGAIGEYLENQKPKIGFFILNDKVVKYALNEGFNKEEIFECFKDKIFSEINKENFFNVMLEP